MALLAHNFVLLEGFRQGDPISPILFLLCIEGLSASLMAKENSGLISSIIIKRNNPSISHLLFPDHCYIFFKINIRDINSIFCCFKEFGEASGQFINYDKYEILFSSRTPRPFRRIIQIALGIKQSTSTGIYLGLPSSIGRNKISLFSYINDRVSNRLFGCKSKLHN